MAGTRKRARIAAARTLSPTVRSLLLAPADGALEFVAGQWLDLYVPTGAGPQKRAYSIASEPGAPLVELAVTLVEQGLASPSLHALAVGSELEFEGPYGFFTRDPPSLQAPALFVATGTGLSPLRSMLFDWSKQAERAPVTLLFGCRSQADMLWGAELEALAAQASDFRLVVTLSRPAPGWSGRTGYVQRHAAELARELPEPHVFICGLNRMVSEMRALCKAELGLPRQRVHSERYD